MVVEVMGRHAGWIALHGGIAGGADIILIPEIPFDFDKIASVVKAREAAGYLGSVVVVAEGARPKHGEQVKRDVESGEFRLGPMRGGEYVVVAFASRVRELDRSDRARAAKLATLGERVRLGELDERLIDLRVIKEEPR